MNAATLAPESAGATLLMPREGESWDDLRRRLAIALKLEAVDPGLQLAPSELVTLMMQDDSFAHLVLASRGSPAFLKVLLRRSGWEGGGPAVDPPSDRHLAAKAASAFSRWAKNGFSRVDEPVFERRISACLACDQLSAPPDRLIYKIATVGSADNRVCRACGCVASRKARLTTENCPLPHANSPGVSRWGEPRAAN